MNLLLHTIALEPARWTPARVSQPLIGLLPAIAAHGFRQLEIFEPHLASVEAGELRAALDAAVLSPVILSSYLDLRPSVTPDRQLAAQTELLALRLEQFGFQKIRLFPSGNPAPAETRATEEFIRRLQTLVATFPATEFLLETHDGSLADDPQLVAQIVTDLALPNLGLLYQPTRFEADAAWEQFQVQKPLIRHLHLQNRQPNLLFATLADGVVPWPKILAALDFAVDATLEFVPLGICSVADFDLAATLRQARSEADYLQTLSQPS